MFFCQIIYLYGHFLFFKTTYVQLVCGNKIQFFVKVYHLTVLFITEKKQ